jgi:hypothetical protein
MRFQEGKFGVGIIARVADFGTTVPASLGGLRNNDPLARSDGKGTLESSFDRRIKALGGGLELAILKFRRCCRTVERLRYSAIAYSVLHQHKFT